MTTTASTLRRLQAQAEASGLRLVGHHDLGGHGDGMQVAKRGDLVYVAHLGTSPMALSVLDCADPSAPRLLRQLPHPPATHRHKVQVVGDLLLQNSERPHFAPEGGDPAPVTGLCVFDLSDPTSPRQVGFYPVPGDGVHRLWFLEPPYAHIAGWLPDVAGRAYHVVDLSDPASPRQAGRWWIPGGHRDDGERWQRLRPGERFEVHGVIAVGERAYAACTDAGMAILDIADPRSIRVISRIDWSPPYGGFVHTCLPLPGRGLVVAVDEALPEHVHGGDKRIWLVDVREERQPVTIATLPVPSPGPGAPWASYRDRPGRFGPHNVHESRPGSLMSERLVFATYYNAGVRVYDISDQYRPEEVAHFVPPAPPGQDAPQLNDLWVGADGLVYVTDRISGGLYVLEFTAGGLG